MTIVCGTDFSESSARAASVGAALAAAWKDDLLLVHALDYPGAEDAGSWSLLEAERARAKTRLEAASARFSPLGISVKTEIGVGASDVVLVDGAERRRARLILVGALGKRGGTLWTLGSTADRVAQTSRVPVLVVRGELPIAEWARGKRSLGVLVGVDLTPSSDAAVRWVGDLESCGPCRVTCAHVYWPPEMKERMHVKGGLPLGEGHPEVEKALESVLRSRIESLRAARPFDLRILGGLGRTADHLVQIAEEAKADLVVVGAKQRTGIARLWYGSVSRSVIDLAPVSVACIPTGGPGSPKAP